MMKWWRWRVYRNDVYAQVMAMTLLVGSDGNVVMKHSGIRNAIRTNFDSNISPMVAATHISAILMADSIEQNNDVSRKRDVEESLAEWSELDANSQRAMRRGMREGTLDQDMLLTRCQWLLLIAQDLLLEKQIDEHDFGILKDSIYGPLKGESQDDRTAARISFALNVILRPKA